MRARNIKPSFFTNETLAVLEPIVQLTFIGLWCLADRDGRLEERPLRIKAELFPYREKTDINGYLTVLERSGFISRYSVNGAAYIQVLAFTKHQSPHHTEKAKGYPPKPLIENDNGGLTVKSPLDNGFYPCQNALNHERGSMNHDSGKPDATATPTPSPSLKKGTRLPADWQPDGDLLQWAKQKRPDLNLTDTVDSFRDYWHAKAGKDACKLDWDKTFANWVRGQKATASDVKQNVVRPAETKAQPETPEQAKARKVEAAKSYARSQIDLAGWTTDQARQYVNSVRGVAL